MSETKEVVSGVSETEDVTKDGALADTDLDKVSGGRAGIDALIAVTQMKVDNANNAALHK